MFAVPKGPLGVKFHIHSDRGPQLSVLGIEECSRVCILKSMGNQNGTVGVEGKGLASRWRKLYTEFTRNWASTCGCGEYAARVRGFFGFLEFR